MMNIEELVKKHGTISTRYRHIDANVAVRAALTELAAEYEQQITELQAMAINNGQQAVLLGERVKQLESERVPVAYACEVRITRFGKGEAWEAGLYPAEFVEACKPVNVRNKVPLFAAMPAKEGE